MASCERSIIEWGGSNACHFCCYRNPATSIVTVVGYIEQNYSSFSLAIFHVCTDEQLNFFGVRLRRLPVPSDIFISTLPEQLISSEDLAYIAAPFHSDGLPDDMYKHFFLQAGGPTQDIEQWLRKWRLE